MKSLKDIAFKTSLASLALVTGLSMAPAAFAHQNNDDWSFGNLMKKPIVKQAAIGAAVGAGAGVLTDKTSVGRGALAGGLTGAGTGAVSQSRYFGDKPLLRY